MILEILRALASWLIIFPVVFLAGHTCKPLIQIKNLVLRGVLFCALGMAGLAYGIAILSALKLLNPIAIWSVLVIILLTRFRHLTDLYNWLKAITFSFFESDSLLDKILSFVFIASVIGLLPGVFSPELGGDALCYQLNLPKIFLEQGSVRPQFFDVNSYFPFLMNYLYLIGLATGGVFSAKLFHFFSGFLLFIFLKEVIQSKTKNQTLALFSALIFWLTPSVYNMVSTTYVDVSLSLYSFLALWIFVDANERNDTFGYFLSGLFLGFAIGIKYLAGLSAIALLGVWFFCLIQDRNFKKIASPFFFWGIGIILGGGFWLLRNWFLAHNPVYPYLGSVFGTEPIPGVKFDKLGVGSGVIHFLNIFWNLFLYPKAFGGFSDRIGIGYLLFFPFVLIASIFIKSIRSYFVYLLIFLILWFKAGQASRYLLPILPAFLYLGSSGFSWMLPRLKPVINVLFSAVGMIVLLVYLVIGFAHYRYVYLLFAGVWSPHEYLLKMERTIPISDWIEKHLPKDAKILIEAEPRQFYINRLILRDAYLKYRTHYDELGMALSALPDFLKGHDVTHLLLSEQLDGAVAPPESLLRQLAAGDSARLIFETTSENIRESRFRYRLYELH